MLQMQKVFLGVVAIAATLGAVQVGAVQLASGHDLADRWQAVADRPTQDAGHNVNRSGKADRFADVKQAPVPTRTVSMRLNDLAETSVLLRVRAVIETGNAKPPVLLQNRKAGSQEADDCLRADGQLPDRGRKAAPARPLCDLILLRRPWPPRTNRLPAGRAIVHVHLIPYPLALYPGFLSP
ncbi:hypothetical protein ACVWZR_004777 [Bradyrhizobium sp. i1.3.1]